MLQILLPPLPEGATMQVGDQQISQAGDRFLSANIEPNLAHDFKKADVPFQRREQALRALFTLFRDVFQPRCVADTSASSQVTLSKINNICYMFWDECALSTWLEFDNQAEMSLSAMENMVMDTENNLVSDEIMDIMRQHMAKSNVRKRTPEEIFADMMDQYANLNPQTAACYQAVAFVMEQCLGLRNPACVESGLHGLGHMATFLPGIACPIIDRYIHGARDKHSALVQYARAARTGMIL